MSSAGVKAWGVWLTVLGIVLSIYVGIIASKKMFSKNYEMSGENLITMVIAASYFLTPAILCFGISGMLAYMEKNYKLRGNTEKKEINNPPKPLKEDNDW